MNMQFSIEAFQTMTSPNVIQLAMHSAFSLPFLFLTLYKNECSNQKMHDKSYKDIFTCANINSQTFQMIQIRLVCRKSKLRLNIILTIKR